MAPGKMPKKLNGSSKHDISVWDEVSKEWFIIEGTICMSGTISLRTMFKRDKYAEEDQGHGRGKGKK